MLEGLKAGETLIVSGLVDLRDGTEVEPAMTTRRQNNAAHLH